MDVPGSAFHESLPGGRAPGRVTLEGEGVRFEWDQGSVALPYHGIRIWAGGANDRLIFFENKAVPGWTVFTEDRSVLEAPIWQGEAGLAEQVGRVRSVARNQSLVIWGVLGALVLGVWGLWSQREAAVAQVAAQIPAAWESQFGKTVFNQVRAGYEEIRDPRIEADFERMVAPLVAVVPTNRFQLTFLLVNDPTINAFAIPGGHVLVHSGVIAKATRQEEVLGVIAHEVAHLSEQHSMRNLIASMGVVLIVQAMLGDVSALLAAAAEHGSFLLQQKFSRDAERDADRVGWDYMKRARIDPRGMIEFFERVRKETGSVEMEKALEFLSTHPDTEERMDRLRARVGELEGIEMQRLSFDFKRFQEAVKAVETETKTPTTEKVER